jgi:hypothetical protein
MQNSEPVQLVSSNQRRSGNQRQVHRVRISSVVEDIETKQYIRLGSDSKINSSSSSNNNNNHSDNEDENDDDQSSDENKKAYELTKPIKNLNYNDFDDDNNNNEAAAIIKTPAVGSHQPKIISQSYKIMPKQQQQQQENKQIGFEEEKIVNSSNNPTNLDARERRRQRLRLSQNESKYF